MAATDKIRVYEQWALEPVNGIGDVRAYEQWVLYAGERAADYVNVSEQWSLEAVRGDEVTAPHVHEQWVLFIVGTQVPTTPVGAWTYTFDGHLFYGLNLGEQGTAVLDTATGKWSDWKSGSFPWLNMNLTVQWRDETYGASLFDPNIVKFNPDSVVDDGFRENTFIASGRIEHQDRAYASMPELQVFGSTGLRGGAITFRYSDNDGESFSADKTRTLTAGARGNNVVFYDLGSLRSPGRIFEIEDTGTLRRIGALKAMVEGAEQ